MLNFRRMHMRMIMMVVMALNLNLNLPNKTNCLSYNKPITFHITI